MMQHRADASPSATRTRVLALGIVALLALTMTVVGAPTAEAAVPAPPLAPTWAADVSPASIDARFAADRLGRTYLSAEGALYSRFRSDGSLDRTVTYSGTGSVRVRGLTVDDDFGVTVTGHVDGDVVFAGTAGPVVVEAGDFEGFVAHLNDAGLVTWFRTIPDAGDQGGGINIFELHQAAGTVVAIGQFVGTMTIGDRTLVGHDHFDWFAAAFDASTGEPSWLTGVVVTDDDPDLETRLVFLSGGVDDDSIAMIGAIDGTRDVESSGPVATIDCTPYDPQDPGESCFALVDLDLTTGEPKLARRLGPEVDQAWRVAQTSEGYAITGFRDSQPPAGPIVDEGFAAVLDPDGEPVWTQTLKGMGPEIEIAVDDRGDVVVADTVTSTVEVGADASAVHLDRPGNQYVGLVELAGGDGSFVRGTTIGGPDGGASTFDTSTLAIGPGDEVLLAGRHGGEPITVGTGPRALTLSGTSDFIASFPPDRPPGAGSTFHPATPTRLLDSRTSTGGWGSKLVAGSPRPLTVAGVAGVPPNATAVVVNLTATDVSAMTYLTAWPTGQVQPTASTLNVVAGDTISNHATIAVGEGGAITMATAQGSANVVADLLGWYAPDDSGSVYHSAEPVRLLDSRTPTGGWGSKLVAGTPRPLAVAGTSDIPADATAVTLSVTVTDTSELTYLRVQPTGSDAANSNIAVNAGQTIANLVTVPIGTGGSITFTNNRGSVNVVADVVGYYDHDTNNGSRFHAVSPRRVLDSRTGNGGYTTPWSPGTTRTVSLDGAVPSEAAITGVVTNLTATDTTAMSYLTLFGSAPRPSISNLLFTPGQTIAVATNSGVDPAGTVSLFNQLGAADLVLDIDGYFVAPPAP